MPYAGWTRSQNIPSVYVVPLAARILKGTEGNIAVNGIGFDDIGDLLLYRKITPADVLAFPQLNDIVEIWITMDQEFTE